MSGYGGGGEGGCKFCLFRKSQNSINISLRNLEVEWVLGGGGGCKFCLFRKSKNSINISLRNLEVEWVQGGGVDSFFFCISSFLKYSNLLGGRNQDIALVTGQCATS